MRIAIMLLAIAATLGTALPAKADSAKAYCEYYLKGRKNPQVSMPCTFSQSQGYITITWKDGVRTELSPVGDQPGNYVDKQGGRVYRQAGLGDRGQIFKMQNGTIYVYWK